MTAPRPGSTGRQARRHRRGQWIGLWLCVATVASFAGVLIWLLTEPDVDGRGIAIGTLGGLTLLFLPLIWWLRRKLKPPRPKHISIQVSADEVRRGQGVSASVTIDREPKPGHALELALVCTERYDVEQQVSTSNGTSTQRVTSEHELHRDAVPVTPGAGSAHGSFEVPASGAFSYEGDCISAVWAISVKERRPNRPDRQLNHPIWVLP